MVRPHTGVGATNRQVHLGQAPKYNFANDLTLLDPCAHDYVQPNTIGDVRRPDLNPELDTRSRETKYRIIGPNGNDGTTILLGLGNKCQLWSMELTLTPLQMDDCAGDRCKHLMVVALSQVQSNQTRMYTNNSSIGNTCDCYLTDICGSGWKRRRRRRWLDGDKRCRRRREKR